jgi:hypothetical protein
MNGVQGGPEPFSVVSEVQVSPWHGRHLTSGDATACPATLTATVSGMREIESIDDLDAVLDQETGSLAGLRLQGGGTRPPAGPGQLGGIVFMPGTASTVQEIFTGLG